MLLKSILFLALSALISGEKICRGPRGAQGKRGPDGIPGAPGANGPDGTNGIAGQMGQGNVIYCATPLDTSLTILDQETVPFGTCVQTTGFNITMSGGSATAVEVLEPGIYQILFYANGNAEYKIAFNGIPTEIRFDGYNDLYTQGQYINVITAGTIVTVIAVNDATIVRTFSDAIAVSLMIQRVANYNV